MLPFPPFTILMVMVTAAVQRGKALIAVVIEVCLELKKFQAVDFIIRIKLVLPYQHEIEIGKKEYENVPISQV